MLRLGVIFGGRSSEHEVSLMSAASVLRVIDETVYDVIKIGITKKGDWLRYEGTPDKIENGQWEKEAEPFSIDKLKETVDFAFPVLHGMYGEDGTIQGLFEMLDIPYAGCGVLASSVAMDKALARDVFRRNGLPMCGHRLITLPATDEELNRDIEEITKEMKFPLFVKPANAGSSVGITKVKAKEELKKAVREAEKYDARILVEEGVNCRELESGVIGNRELTVSTVGEILPSADFYDYTAKYFDGGQTRICVPADISDELREEIRTLAAKAYKAIDCSGFARVDFFYDKDNKRVLLNEINTIPGFTAFSMFSKLFEASGLTYREQIERIIELGYERYNAKNNR
ncbi:MAG: D-alanine--D-alanine ligase [Clostridia bacterium]|nr:D-alanine--D-alanine ligase [Clostridia bacterium]